MQSQTLDIIQGCVWPEIFTGAVRKGTVPTDIVMPQMGESIFEGTITKWLKKPGDKVQRDEPLFEISTDKVDAEIPAPASGVLQDIKVVEGNTVQVNTVVGTIAGDGEAQHPPGSAAQATVPEPAACLATEESKRRRAAPPPARAATPANCREEAGRPRAFLAVGSQNRPRARCKSVAGDRHRHGWTYYQAGHYGVPGKSPGPPLLRAAHVVTALRAMRRRHARPRLQPPSPAI